MTLPVIPFAAGVALIALGIYKYIIYPAVLSPLAKIPNAHWTSSISPLWILYHRQQQQDTPTIHTAHTKLGPIIRLAPNEISVNCVEGGIRTIYAGGFEKGDWYSNVFSNYGVEPMFAMERHGEHSKRKRMLSNIYAKSSLQASPALTKQTEIIINDRLRPRLKREVAAGGGVLEIYDVFSAATMDFVTGYIFGMKSGSNFLDNYEAGVRLFREFKARQKHSFWVHELPNLTRWLKNLGLKWLVVPTWVDSANFDLEGWVMSLCEKAEGVVREGEDEVNVEDQPTVYSQLRNVLLKDGRKEGSGEQKNVHTEVEALKLDIASELLDHTLAGFDTSGITLTWLAWQLSRTENKVWQDRLRKEIATLEDSLDAKAIDSLPVLQAVLMETLRLHAAIPGNQPRITPSTTLATLGDAENGVVVKEISGGVRVQAQAWSLHRNPSVFPDPESWNPSRWLPESTTEASRREMFRWFWAFGSGGRMCVGSNLAMLDMKVIVVGVWGRFGTTVVDDEGMVPNGGYMAEPLGVGSGGKKGIGGSGFDGEEERRRFLRVRVEESCA